MEVCHKNSLPPHKVKHNCDNINCNYNDTKGLCCLFNPDNCKYRQLQKDYAELKKTYRKQRNKRIDKLQKKNAEAKEIIKKLMEFAEIDNREYEEAYKEAKQFLKEE